MYSSCFCSHTGAPPLDHKTEEEDDPAAKPAGGTPKSKAKAKAKSKAKVAKVKTVDELIKTSLNASYLALIESKTWAAKIVAPDILKEANYILTASCYSLKKNQVLKQKLYIQDSCFYATCFLGRCTFRINQPLLIKQIVTILLCSYLKKCTCF